MLCCPIQDFIHLFPNEIYHPICHDITGEKLIVCFSELSHLSLLQVKSQLTHRTPQPNWTLHPGFLGALHHPAPPALGITTAITNQNQSRGQRWKGVFERLFPARICLPGLHPLPGPGCPRRDAGWGSRGGPRALSGVNPRFSSPLVSFGVTCTQGAGALRAGKNTRRGEGGNAPHFRDAHKIPGIILTAGSLVEKEKEGKQTRCQ